MKIQKYKVLLLGGLFLFLTTTFFAQASPRELVLQDVFVFKVSDQVYSLEDLRLLSANFMTLSCLYEDSILIKAFEKIIKLNSDQASFKIQKSETIKFTDLQKQSFRTFIDFASNKLQSHF